MDAIRRKLEEVKKSWAREGRLLTDPPEQPDRLPPGQRLVRDWPVLDLGDQPHIRPEDWSLQVSGLVENPLRWTWDDFRAQPQTDITTDIHCVTSWSRYDNRWQGVSARQFLAVVRPRPEARFIIFHAWDGYTTNLPLDAFDDDDVLLAHSWEGAPLTREHGGPVRVVVPKRYFWKSAKWLRAMTFLDRDRPGFWEVRGYHNDADPWKQERYG